MKLLHLRSFAPFLPFLVYLLWIASNLCLNLFQIHSPPPFTTTRKETMPSDTANYLIAGLWNQPDTAFAFLANQLEGDIIYLPYRSAQPVNYDNYADFIRTDAAAHHYAKVRVFAISVGCIVTQQLDRCPTVANLELYEINPCHHPEFLRENLYPWARVTSAVFSALDNFVFGHLSRIPFIHQSGHFFAPNLVISQLRYIAYGEPNTVCLDDPATTCLIYPSASFNTHVKAIVLSAHDEYLDNTAISTYYPDSVIRRTVDTSHGNTIAAADLYAAVFQEIL